MQAGGASQTQMQSQLQPDLSCHGTMQGYDPGAFFCEMLRPGQPQHPTLTLLLSRLAALPIESLRRRAAEAERDLLERGITFTVYSDATAIDRILPFDLIPRVITPAEWQQIETGVIQRVRALNMFLYDIYHERKILADKIVPAELVLKNTGYCEAMVGFDVPFNTYVHVCGTDIVRDETGAFRVLEDNARTPSGVAYVVENRHMSLRVMSDLMTGLRVRSVDEYGLRLHNAMAEIAPARRGGSAGRGAVARHLQLGLFRACLPGARDGRAAGRRPRPVASRAARCGCAPPRAWRRCTRSTGGSATISSIRTRSIRKACWACAG